MTGLRVDLYQSRRRLRRRGTREWRWIAKAANGRAIAGSLEGYANVGDAVRGFAKLRGGGERLLDVVHLPADVPPETLEAVQRAIREVYAEPAS